MATKLPPQPVGVPPGHSFWNDWYEKIRDAFNSGQVATTWANIDFSGSNITDIVSRSHENLQGLQGGTAGEHQHLTNVQHALATSLAAGTYSPTLTSVANIDASITFQAQFLRVGSVVTVSGKLSVDPTAGATLTRLGISLPIASNIGAQEDVAGTASTVSTPAGAILGDAANNRAELNFTSTGTVNQDWYFTFTYEVI